MRIFTVLIFASLLAGCGAPRPRADISHAAVVAIKKGQDTDHGCRLSVMVLNNTRYEISGVNTQIALSRGSNQPTSQFRIVTLDAFMPPGQTASFTVFPMPATRCAEIVSARAVYLTLVSATHGNLLLDNENVRTTLE